MGPERKVSALSHGLQDAATSRVATGVELEVSGPASSPLWVKKPGRVGAQRDANPHGSGCFYLHWLRGERRSHGGIKRGRRESWRGAASELMPGPEERGSTMAAA